MGVVYLATDPLLRRTVAIKVLTGHQDEELHERFAREARSAASLRHHNVVTIFDIGEDDGQPFIAMEFLDGESMAELIRRRAPFSVERRLQLMIELCAGLGYAHRNGIVHRDIKPGNLMITAEGALKVLDFGLVRLTSEGTSTGLTRAGSLMGTPHYMSPEQVNGQAVDPRSDIFSVGLVLYELVTYRRAFEGDSAPVVLHNIVHATPTPISDVAPDIDPELAQIVDKSVEKDPEQRYQTLAALAADLERVRARYAEAAETPTLINVRPERQRGAHDGAEEPTPARRANLDTTAHRRAAQVEAHIAAAEAHLAAGDYQAAVAECENAVLLNPQHELAVELLGQAHAALDDHQVQALLDEARQRLAAGALTEAQALIEQSLMLRADSTEALSLKKELREKRAARERTAQGSRAANAALERAIRSLESGAFEAAARSASEVLAYEPGNPQALEVKRRSAEAIGERRQAQAHDREANDTAEQARLLARAGDVAGALALLDAFDPAHPAIAEAIDELTATVHRPALARTAKPRATPAMPDAPTRVTERRPPVAWVGPAAAVLVVMAGGVWFFTRQAGPDVPGATPLTRTAPSAEPDVLPVENEVKPGPPAEPDITPIHTAFTKAMDRSDLGLAAQVLIETPPSIRRHATLAADVRRLLEEARKRASDALSQALKLGVPQRAAKFRTAQAKRAEATDLERNGELPEAARGFIAAAELFAEAAALMPPPPLKAAPALPTTVKPSSPESGPAPTGTPTPTAPVPVIPAPAAPEPTATATPGSTAPPPPSAPPPPATTTTPPRPPVDTAALDTAAIRDALAAYVAAYERLDAAAIRRVYPSAPNLDRLSDIRSYKLDLEMMNITLQGDKATVTAVRRLKAQMKNGATQDVAQPTEFSLRRAGSGWVIERVR